MGLLKTLFFIFLFYYAFKFLVRLFAPVLVKKMADTMQRQAEQQFGNQPEQSTVREGETIIDKKPQTNHQSKSSVGEYVDFEEIE